MARRKNKKRVRAKDQVAFSEAWSADAQQGSTRESTQPSPTTTAVPPHHRNSRPRVEDTTHLDAYLEYMQISHPTGPLVTSNTCKAIENRHLRHDDIRQLIRAVDNQLTGAVTDQHAPWSPSQITIPPTYATAESTSALVTHAVDWAGIVDPSVYGTIGRLGQIFNKIISLTDTLLPDPLFFLASPQKVNPAEFKPSDPSPILAHQNLHILKKNTIMADWEKKRSHQSSRKTEDLSSSRSHRSSRSAHDQRHTQSSKTYKSSSSSKKDVLPEFERSDQVDRKSEKRKGKTPAASDGEYDVEYRSDVNQYGSGEDVEDSVKREKHQAREANSRGEVAAFNTNNYVRDHRSHGGQAAFIDSKSSSDQRKRERERAIYDVDKFQKKRSRA
ncbi:hypothetical protein HYQ44_019069 [Verticillium longisporum]|nr:hypothetical protein HYQ44_019069 [Verticillium longisporum]